MLRWEMLVHSVRLYKYNNGVYVCIGAALVVRRVCVVLGVRCGRVVACSVCRRLHSARARGLPRTALALRRLPAGQHSQEVCAEC